MVHIGTLSGVDVHPREVFKPAILNSAAAIIVAHKHPSGDPSPSKQDIEVTRRLRETGSPQGLVVLALFTLLALQNLGVELLPLLAGLGVVGAGIALATQGVLSNVVAGLTIIFTKPFRVGEYVSLLHEEGVVLDVTIFNTTLGHWDRSRVVIPNRKIVGEILHNYGEIRQLDLSVGVGYEADVAQALATVDEVLRASPRVLKEHAPVLQVTSLSESSIDIGVRPWVKVTDFVAASGELNRSILEALRARGIGHPFPQQELRVVAGSAGVGTSVLPLVPVESARQARVTR